MSAPHVPGAFNFQEKVLELVGKFPGITNITLTRRLGGGKNQIGHAVRRLIKLGKVVRRPITDKCDEHCGEKGLYLPEGGETGPDSRPGQARPVS
jgi:hypothetical protein